MFNVQGLRTRRINKFQSLELKNLFANNDIIFLTETWADEYSDLRVNGFNHFQLNRSEYKSNTKRASGGIIIYIREHLANSDSKLLIHKENDDILWVRIEGTKLKIDGDLFICLCYNLPSDSGRQSLVDEDIFDRMCSYIYSVKNEAKNKCYFLICGDMNARIADRNDFVSQDFPTHIDTLPDDYICDINLPRATQDKGFNANGSLLLDFCRKTGLRVVNGRIAEDAGIGKCTYVGARGTSLIDYVIADPELFKYFSSFRVEDPNILSDHCMVNFMLCFDMSKLEFDESDSNIDEEDIISYPCKGKYIWDSNMADVFLDNLQSENIQEQLTTINDRINQANSFGEIDNTVESFVSIFKSVSEPFYKEFKKA